MRAISRLLLLATVSALFTGCFQMERVVTVNPDGSGTVTETFVILKDRLAQMKMTAGVSQVADDAAKARYLLGNLDEAQLREHAAAMGGGVSLAYAKRVTTAAGEGFMAKFAFADIGKLKLDLSHSDIIPNLRTSDAALAVLGMATDRSAYADLIDFQFTRGRPSQLTVNLPPFRPSETARSVPAPSSTEENQAIAIKKAMLQNAHISLVIVTNGKLVKTNADCVADNRITLREIEFDKLFHDTEKLKTIYNATPRTIEEALASLKGVEGVKVETKQNVSIFFE